MPQHGTEASLSPAAGTSCGAACIAFDVHHQPLRFHTKATKELRLGGNAWWATRSKHFELSKYFKHPKHSTYSKYFQIFQIFSNIPKLSQNVLKNSSKFLNIPKHPHIFAKIQKFPTHTQIFPILTLTPSGTTQKRQRGTAREKQGELSRKTILAATPTGEGGVGWWWVVVVGGGERRGMLDLLVLQDPFLADLKSKRSFLVFSCCLFSVFMFLVLVLGV